MSDPGYIANGSNGWHTGRVSAGCVTVEPSGWTALYEYLILCRNNDGASVGSTAVLR